MDRRQVTPLVSCPGSAIDSRLIPGHLKSLACWPSRKGHILLLGWSGHYLQLCFTLCALFGVVPLSQWCCLRIAGTFKVRYSCCQFRFQKRGQRTPYGPVGKGWKVTLTLLPQSGETTFQGLVSSLSGHLVLLIAHMWPDKVCLPE